MGHTQVGQKAEVSVVKYIHNNNILYNSNIILYGPSDHVLRLHITDIIHRCRYLLLNTKRRG